MWSPIMVVERQTNLAQKQNQLLCAKQLMLALACLLNIIQLSDRLLGDETASALKTIRTILENMEDHGIVDIFEKYSAKDIAASFYALYRLQGASKQYQSLYIDKHQYPPDLEHILEDLSHYVVYASGTQKLVSLRRFDEMWNSIEPRLAHMPDLAAAYGWKMDLAFKGKLHLGDEQALIRKTNIEAEDIIKLSLKSKAHLPVCLRSSAFHPPPCQYPYTIFWYAAPTLELRTGVLSCS